MKRMMNDGEIIFIIISFLSPSYNLNVYFSLRGNIIANNSYISIADIGDMPLE